MEERLGVEVTESQYKNQLRMVSDKFKELVIFNFRQNNVLVYPFTSKIESLVIDNFELKRDLNSANQNVFGS